jgi:death-on-curing protein
MRYLTLGEVRELHRRLIGEHGGAKPIRDEGALESAVAQPMEVFGGQDLYPTLAAKASALCFSLVRNHAFVDGNKRVGHAAAEALLMLNGHELESGVDEAEGLVLGLANAEVPREAVVEWFRAHIVELRTN